jgi:hypothetical protein
VAAAAEGGGKVPPDKPAGPGYGGFHRSCNRRSSGALKTCFNPAGGWD